MAAAHEASDHAGRAESTNVGATTLEQLDADVTRIANDYVHIPPVPMMVEMLRVRRRVYRLLEGHQRPADTAHLYLLAGTLSGLLANASTDLGYYDAAGEQIRASWAYAELCGHNGLRAWTRGMHALIEYWSERPRRGVLLGPERPGVRRFGDGEGAIAQYRGPDLVEDRQPRPNRPLIRAADDARELAATDTCTTRWAASSASRTRKRSTTPARPTSISGWRPNRRWPPPAGDRDLLHAAPRRNGPTARSHWPGWTTRRRT